MLGIFSIAPFFLILALLWAVAEGVARVVPFYRRELIPHANRYDVLDGLRGFLALAVFLLHSSINYFYLRTAIWEPTPARFYSQMGQAGVICFFMITGFLFWSKAIDADRRVRFIPLFRNRWRRLAPLYWVMSLIVIALVLFRTGLHLHDPITSTIRELIAAASVNIVPQGYSLNGVNTVPINGAVIWTLTVEWLFYLTLPLTGRLASPRRVWIIAVPIALLAAIAPSATLFLHFVFGMLTAHLVRWRDLRPLASRPWFAVVPTGALALVTLTGPLPLLDPLASALVFIAFVSFIYGNDLFGLLRTRGARLLSTTSYSIYLLHAIVLYVVLNSLNRVRPITEMADATYWLIVAACGVCVVLASSLTFAIVEYPFMKKRSRTVPTSDSAPAEIGAVEPIAAVQAP